MNAKVKSDQYLVLERLNWVVANGDLSGYPEPSRRVDLPHENSFDPGPSSGVSSWDLLKSHETDPSA